MTYPPPPWFDGEHEVYEPNVLWFEDEKPCWNCGIPTHFIEVNFEARLCSIECDYAKWDEYSEACRASDERARKDSMNDISTFA